MPNTRFSVVALLGSCATLLLLVASAGAAPAANQSSARSNRPTNVYFRSLSPEGQTVLKRLCAEHNGQVITNDEGQMGCQVGSLNDSKNISDGAAKGQANE
jgi:hypothetical protein